MDWFKDNKTLAYTIAAAVGIVIFLIFLAKFWSYAIVGVCCLGVGYYYGRRHKNESKRLDEKENKTFF